MSLSDIERAAGETFSPLAWEIARTATLERTDGGGICAKVVLRGRGEMVRGLGATTTAAMRDLATELDTWAERILSAESPHGTGRP